MLQIASVTSRRNLESGLAKTAQTRKPRSIPLAIGLAIAAAGATTRTQAGGHDVLHVSQLWTVTNCDDDGAGSLRAVVGSNQTQSGDVVDLSQLSCGTITLSTGAISVSQADLTLIGPGKESLVIGAGNASRLFDHGSGKLSLEHLSLASGAYHAGGTAFGGCVRSSGTVYLLDTVVDDCHVSSDTGVAAGGAIFAANVTLVLSRVSGSSAASASGSPYGATVAYGGAVAAGGTAIAKYSEIDGNSVQTSAPSGGEGGAIVARTYALITHSAIDGNDAPCAGGVAVAGAAFAVEGVKIVNSTISDNHSDHCAAVTINAPGAYIANSTIAFNHAEVGAYAGVDVRGTNPFAAYEFTVQSTIVANNTVGLGAPADIHVESIVLAGANNLVMSLNGPPPAGFVESDADPQLGPLQWNGGSTRTHALGPNSPAIGIGNNAASTTNDQRGAGYPRTTGASNTVDIGAFQFDSIFADAFNF